MTTVGNFTFTPTAIDGVVIVDVKAYGDERGYFMETYVERDFIAGGITARFVQDNQSSSVKNVLRGLHFQKQYPQAKLVRVLQGAVYDVAVDTRPGSPTWGQWVGVELTAENRRQFFIPRGLAHGFLVLSDTAQFAYKCDDFYHPNDEGGVAWDDPTLAIPWPLPSGAAPILSAKDQANPALASLPR
jgi:dTDP-4-dehydrorhamnose 3,5-epimerase